MTVDTTIGVSKEAKEAAQDAKHDNETWDQFIQRCTEQPPEIVEFRPAGELNGDRVSERYNVNTDALATEIARRIDYSQLAGQVADQLEGRMR